MLVTPGPVTHGMFMKPCELLEPTEPIEPAVAAEAVEVAGDAGDGGDAGGAVVLAGAQSRVDGFIRLHTYQLRRSHSPFLFASPPMQPTHHPRLPHRSIVQKMQIEAPCV